MPQPLMEITGWFGLTRGRALTVESILVQGTLQAGTWGVREHL